MSAEHLIKPKWQDRVVQVDEFHKQKLREAMNSNSNWTIEQTAELLQRSVSSVREDVMLASWLKTHPNQVGKYRRITDALNWVREKREQMRLGIV